jgi:uncharacterized protein YdhG (YjbR/CyaY superfamily)
MTAKQKTAKRTTANGKKSAGLSAGERAALKERVQELKAEANRANGESAVLEKIAEMPPRDRAIVKRLHAIVKATAPALEPKTWYGMPAYAKGGKVVCFFKPAEKFKSRYATIGFEEAANLDDGDMWVTSFAVTKLTDADAKKITALVKKAVS